MVSNPLALIAEVTHRCPLHCVYCSNPLELAGTQSELSTDEWTSVFQQVRQTRHAARALYRRRTAGAHGPDGTDRCRARSGTLHQPHHFRNRAESSSVLQALVDAGLDHIQISFQDSREEAANWIAGAKAHAHKIELSRGDSQAVGEKDRVHRESGRAPAEPRPSGRNDRVHRATQSRAHGDRPRAVLRMGAGEPRRAAANAGATGKSGGDRGRGREAAGRTDSHRFRRARLLREVSQGLHGRLGTKIDADQSCGQGAALPCGGSAAGLVV